MNTKQHEDEYIKRIEVENEELRQRLSKEESLRHTLDIEVNALKPVWVEYSNNTTKHDYHMYENYLYEVGQVGLCRSGINKGKFSANFTMSDTIETIYTSTLEEGKKYIVDKFDHEIEKLKEIYIWETA